MKLKLLSFLFGLLAVTASMFAQAVNFATLSGDEKNVVQFVSEATMEKIVGKTNNVSGTITLDLAQLASTTKSKFEVDLRTLDTGISLRNQHMRENHLDTDEYPIASFDLKRLTDPSQPSLRIGEETSAIAVGDFTIHGVAKEYSIPVHLKYIASSPETAQRLFGSNSNLLYITAQWTVKLADHGISRPAFLFLRLAPEQHVSISVALAEQ